jgi:membrane protein DedA with SNARE-associated domain
MDSVGGLQQTMVHFFASYECLALFLFFFVSEAGVPLPVPGPVLIFYAAFLAGQGQGNVFLILFSAIIGAVLGSWLLYTVAAKGGHPLLLKYGKYIRLQPGKIDSVETWFKRQGGMSIFLGRMIPGLRLQTTIAAGLFRVPRSLFLSSTALSAATWIVTCFSIGFVLRNKYEWLIDGITNPFLMAAIVLPLLAITASFVLSRRKAITSKLKQSAGVAA